MCVYNHVCDLFKVTDLGNNSCSQYAKLNLNPSPKSNQIFKSSIHQSSNMTNKTLLTVRVGTRAWIKIYIRHAENMELLPRFKARPLVSVAYALQIRHSSMDIYFKYAM